MKGFLVASALLLITLAVRIWDTPTPEELATRIAELEKRSLPVMLSDTVRLEEHYASGNEVFISYTLTDMEEGCYAECENEYHLLENAKFNLCNSRASLSNMKKGVFFTFKYYDNNGAIMAQETMKAADCT